MHGTPHIVSDVLTPTVATVVRGTAFKDSVRTMQEHQVSALPLLNAAERLVGSVGIPSCAGCPTSRRPAR